MQNYAGDESYPTTIPIVDDSDDYQSAAPMAAGLEALADRTSALAAELAATNTQVEKSLFPLHSIHVFGDATIGDFSLSGEHRAYLSMASYHSPTVEQMYSCSLEAGDVVEISASLSFLSYNFPTDTLRSCQKASLGLYGAAEILLPCSHDFRPHCLAAVAIEKGLTRVAWHASTTISVSGTYYLNVRCEALDSWTTWGTEFELLTHTEGILEWWAPYDGILKIYRGFP